MRTLIKLGGSLQRYPDALKSLCQQIVSVSEKHDLFILPGGGSFADKVRVLDTQYMLDQTTTHWMAIAAMEAYAYLLHYLIPNSLISHELSETPLNRPKVILPYVHLRAVDAFSHSWDITSDSIALYYANQLNSDIILIKAIDGIVNSNGSLIDEIDAFKLGTIKTNVVDDYFVETFIQYGTEACWIINGRVSSRLNELLQKQRTIGTKVIK